MSNRTVWWSVTMAIIAAIYFCSAPATNSFGDAGDFISRVYGLLRTK